MKIKMIDLVELMLERKAPKKIRFLGINMTFIETAEWGDYKGDDCNCRLSEFRLIDCLNEDAEIIEEPKKIEKIEMYQDEEGHYFLNKQDRKVYVNCDEIDFMVDKFNELIDEINNLKEND